VILFMLYQQSHFISVFGWQDIRAARCPLGVGLCRVGRDKMPAPKWGWEELLSSPGPQQLR
jgi:hypothetical protein